MNPPRSPASFFRRHLFRAPSPRPRTRRIALSPLQLEARDCPATNLITNPSVETPGSSASLPLGWHTDHYGTNTETFTYATSGFDGQRSLRVDMTSRSSGDAKWYFDDVPVTPGQKYTFSDVYTSDVATSATIRYRLNTGKFKYVGYYPAAAASTPTNFTFDFTAPSNAVSATVFHLIATKGYLATDAFSLTQAGAPAPDTTPPTASVTAPAANTTVSGTIALTAQASDNVGVAGVRFLVDGTQIGSEDTASPYQVSLNTTTLSDGSHSIIAIARDAAGNSTTSAAVAITVANADTTAPSVSITAPTANTSVSGTIMLAAQASDNVAVAGVQFLVDGNQVGTDDLTAPYQLTLDTTTLTDGSHSIAAIARDAAGNSATSAAVPVTVANSPTPTPTNLIQNPSVESLGSNGDPVGWTRNSWGTNAATFALVAGTDGSRAVRVEMSSYSSGDAKWVFNPVAVTPGTTYTFSDAYRSSVGTKIVIQYTQTDGTFSYVYVASVNAASNWTNTSYLITVPANAASMTVFHLIEGVGWLETDKFSLSAAGTGGGTTGAGMISLAFDDGWLSQLQNAVPLLQQANLPATFYIVTRANQGGASWERVQNASFETAAGDGSPLDWRRWQTGANTAAFTYATVGSDGTRSGRIDVSAYTSGDDAWYFQDVAVQPGTAYMVSHQYNANVSTSVLVRFTLHNGGVSYVDMGGLAGTAGQWQTQQFTVTAPANADAMTVIHRISQVGSLWVDNFSVKEVSPYSNPDYMTPAQIQSLAAAGYEVGAHTMTHADLTTLSAAGALAEIDGSRADLAALGITAQTFAYPYGDYNTALEQVVAADGFIAARTVNDGTNTSTTDHFALTHHEVDFTTTVADVQGWINTAVQTKTWLILTFHRIDNSGDLYSATPGTLQQIINLVSSSGLTPATVAQGVASI